MKLHTQLEVYQDCLNFYLVDDHDGKKLIGKHVEMEPMLAGLLVSPTFRLPMPDAQEMFEQMWAQGFRSKHDKGNSEALDAARREHIGDLRKAAKLA